MKKSILRRLFITGLILALFSGSLYFMMDVFRDNLVFFFSPTEILESPLKAQKKARLGGVVKKGSVTILSKKTHTLTFVVTDFNQDMNVHYQGFLPDLFREGQGVVAEGYYDEKKGLFFAKKILAKHDENYKPPQLEKLLSKNKTYQNFQRSQGTQEDAPRQQPQNLKKEGKK